MAKNNEIEAGARIVAEDFKLPSGRRKAIAKLVRDHLEWFAATETRGMVVEDILNTLTAAGATYEDGTPINYATLSNALWRVRNSSTPEPKNQGLRLGQSKQDRAVERAIPHPERLEPSGRRQAKSSKPKGRLAANETPPKQAGTRPHPTTAKTSSADVLGFMRRAAAIRRPQSDR